MTKHTERRIAVVTGASRGIGRATALALADDGYRVVCIARSQKALETLDDEIKEDGRGEATLIPFDLRDLDGIDKIGAALFERFGRIDALASCAGALGSLTPANQATPAVMDEVTKINFLAPQRLLRALHPLLRASDAGRAVFLTSNTREPKAYWAPYVATKAALEALVLCYAAEVAITPIKVNLFNPGPTRTAIRQKAFPGEDPMSVPAPEEVAPRIAEMLRPEYVKNGELVAAFAPRIHG